MDEERMVFMNTLGLLISMLLSDKFLNSEYKNFIYRPNYYEHKFKNTPYKVFFTSIKSEHIHEILVVIYYRNYPIDLFEISTTDPKLYVLNYYEDNVKKSKEFINVGYRVGEDSFNEIFSIVINTLKKEKEKIDDYIKGTNRKSNK